MGDGSPTKKIVIDNRSFSVSHVFNSERNYTANVVLSSGESQSFNINISKCSNSANIPSVITSPPNVIIQNGIASISWNKPSNDGGCNITGYIIKEKNTKFLKSICHLLSGISCEITKRRFVFVFNHI